MPISCYRSRKNWPRRAGPEAAFTHALLRRFNATSGMFHVKHSKNGVRDFSHLTLRFAGRMRGFYMQMHCMLLHFACMVLVRFSVFDVK
jgi:hypothetical protein